MNNRINFVGYASSIDDPSVYTNVVTDSEGDKWHISTYPKKKIIHIRCIVGKMPIDSIKALIEKDFSLNESLMFIMCYDNTYKAMKFKKAFKSIISDSSAFSLKSKLCDLFKGFEFGVIQ